MKNMILIYIFFFIQHIQLILTNEIYKFSIEEKSPINTFIADLSIELQIKTFAIYKFDEILPINKNLFSINNQTGYLTTITNNLDREQMCLKQQCSCSLCEIYFQLIIRIDQKLLYKIIQIHIQDRNDHSPIFDNQSQTRIIYIKENVPLGYRIILPTATDPDEGLNSIQSYNLDGINSDDFDVDYSFIDIPYLIVRSSLDYQHRSSYSLKLIASDNNQPSKSRSGSIELDIRIINQSIPIFSQSVYHIDIREDTRIGTDLLKVQAFIDDNNQDIFYEILNEYSPCIINRLTGNIQLKRSLDYEKEKSYRLTIKAFTNSIPSYAVIFIRVIDVNDNPVLIHIKPEGNVTLNDKTKLSIPEDTSIGTILGHVILNDLDSFVNGNPYLQLTTNEIPLPLIYKLVYQNQFQNTKLYSLILHTKLDRELKSNYNNIQLLAHDSGTPTLHTNLNLILNITDVNDCIPQILTNSTVYNINENNPIGLIIDTLIGYDGDIGLNSKYEYSILNQTDLLIINPQTGQISLNQSIDYETFHTFKNQSIYDLEYLIQTHDFGQPSLSSQKKITLRIHDLNDNSPEFDQNHSYNWSLSKSNLQIGSIIGRIYAFDNDSGLQGIINYSIHSFDTCLTLEITSLGYVYISSDLSCSYLTYTFEITASDYGQPNPRLTKQLLFIHINSNENDIETLPKILPLTIQRTIVDINSLGNISFIIDITNNQTIQPKIYLNHTDIYTCWNISSTGEFRLISHPYALSYILSLYIIDEYTDEKVSFQISIDICNSTIRNSCKKLSVNNHRKENEILLFWAICLALIITCICVFIFSIMTCLCCRKRKDNLSNDDIQSEKTLTNSIIKEDDRDSACVINTNSSIISSGIIPIRKTISWDSSSSNNQIYQPSTYFYDLKLAELIRNNQHPPCVHLNSHSLSSDDYGFASSEISTSPTISTSSRKFHQSPERQFNKQSFISTHECVV